MSFGEREYQHRFHNPLRGKARQVTLPKPHYPYAYGEYNDYLYNSLLLDTYKRDADYNRIHRRLSSHPYSQPYPYYHPHPYDTIPRVITEPPIIESPSRVVYVNKESPDVLPSLINYSAMASRVHQAEREAERAQTEAAKEREQLREYRHKYERLKGRLREEVGERRVREAELRRVRELELETEKVKLDQMGHAVMQMSQQVSDNSRIMHENLKLREELGELTQDRILVFPSVPTVLSRSVLVDRPSLDSQYREMRRLKTQIGELDRKLGYSSSHS